MTRSVAFLGLVGAAFAASVPPGLQKRQECLPALPPVPPYKAEITYDACYLDNSAPRTLGGPNTRLSDNTPQRCADYCGQSGYTYAGVEYGFECYCGNAIANPKAPSEETCTMPCAGDAEETCGGSFLINIWKIGNPSEDGGLSKFPDCTRDPLCSNGVCDPSLSVKDRAEALLSLWTIDEKLANIVEKSAGVPRIGIAPYQWWSEGLHGLASQGVIFEAPGTGEWDAATSFPQPITIAAAFDDDIVTSIGDVISTETRAFNGDGRVGLDLYTPNINNFKNPLWGRGQETPGEDPFHAQSYTRALLAGLERKVDGYKKVLVTCKHYVGNDFDDFGEVTRHNYNAELSPHDLNGFYLEPFRACAERQGGAFMCSYNSVNGEPACANSYLMQDILREHWGWDKEDHWISTDCGVVENVWKDHKFVETPGEAAAAVLAAGTDLNCEWGELAPWKEAWNNSLITEEQLDKALSRLWGSLISVGWFDPAEDQVLRKLGWKDVNTKSSQQLAYDTAVAGTVLLKNDGGHLPLKKKKSVVLIGPWVNATIQMQGNYYGPPPYLISPRQAAKDFGLDFTWAAGSAINAPDAKLLKDALKKADEADEIIFMGGLDHTLEGESHDRTNLTWPTPQLEVIRELSKLGKPVTVVQFGGGQLDGTELLKNKAVRGIVWGGYPGQSGGKAIIDVLYGVKAPAGRLPITQYPASYIDEVTPIDMGIRPGPTENGTNPGRTHIWYTGKPIIPFGHGLHYTDFKVSFPAKAIWQGEFRSSGGKTSKVKSLVEGKPWMEVVNLPAVSIPVRVENIGSVKSDYVVLLFARSDAGPKPRPKKTLVGYTRVKDVKPGQKKTTDVVLQLDRFLRVNDDGDRVLYPGTYEIFADIDAKATLKVKWDGTSVVVEEFPKAKE